jgi:hypothetical protein
VRQPFFEDAVEHTLTFRGVSKIITPR